MKKAENLLKLNRTLDRLINQAATAANRQQEYHILEEIELLNKVVVWIKNGLIKLD